MTRRIIVEIISLLFILLFVYAAANKLMDIEKFRIQLGQSPLLTPFAGWVVFAVPVLEIIISFGLALHRFRLLALYASFALMVVFTTYIIAILNFTAYIPCSCGGVLEKLGWTEHLIFNGLFILFALLGILCQTQLRSDDEYDSKTQPS
jgi:uncharacterized membrane protein YphA (DoxX/SURF4 family)